VCPDSAAPRDHAEARQRRRAPSLRDEKGRTIGTAPCHYSTVFADEIASLVIPDGRTG
jgi:hypothetical protein